MDHNGTDHGAKGRCHAESPPGGTSAMEPMSDVAAGDRVRAEDRAHVFRSWSAQRLVTPLPIAAAAGSHV